eukprot:CAMPEP_0174877960 /NCGR_PEP_ID=MMETSP1114-20130205/82521_1 /TAXON_ID=312471 /ORGANISM="Neobodo designis, Strain CCAP 1951/1" /LENGTH=151 /DNA_ID=CAMNT_0016113347 /DNA_START=1059 /DNA_END=1511 /DNA_ORIENTATION=-
MRPGRAMCVRRMVVKEIKRGHALSRREEAQRGRRYRGQAARRREFHLTLEAVALDTGDREVLAGPETHGGGKKDHRSATKLPTKTAITTRCPTKYAATVRAHESMRQSVAHLQIKKGQPLKSEPPAARRSAVTATGADERETAAVRRRARR